MVSSLTEEGPNDLAEELNRGEPVDENAPIDDEDENWESWTPDPVETLISSKSILPLSLYIKLGHQLEPCFCRNP